MRSTVRIASSPPYVPRWEFDVFLSFRGYDVRYAFITHLYAALVRKGINTFKDDKKLDKGTRLSVELFNAKIEKSRFSIVVFSRSYTSSDWCLNELLRIMECVGSKQHIVIPLYYHVKRTDVKKQQGKFGKAFEMLKNEHSDKPETVERWTAALREVTKFVGWPLTKHRDESAIIEKIVSDVLSKINPINGHPTSNLSLLLKETDKAVVHFESPMALGASGWSWVYEDGIYALKNDNDPDAVRAIILDSGRIDDVRITTTAFARINKLRLFIICDFPQSSHSKCLTKKDVLYNIRVFARASELQLWGMQAALGGSEPPPTPSYWQQNLVELKLRHCSVEQLWEGIEVFIKSATLLSRSNKLGGLILTDRPMEPSTINRDGTALVDKHNSFAARVGLFLSRICCCRV